MEQYSVPQFIDKEGKIISFLTFSQFFWLVGGGAFCLLFYYIFPLPVFVVLSAIVALTVGAIAFLKIDNTSVMTIMLNFFKFTNQTKNYTWKKKESAYPFKIKKRPELKDVPAPFTPAPQIKRLDETKKMVELNNK